MIKVPEQKLIVKIEHEEQSATLTFRKPKLNRILDSAVLPGDENSPERLRHVFDRVMAELLEVGDVVHEDGTPFTVAEFIALDLPLDFALAVVVAYQRAAYPRSDIDPKKENLVTE